ASESSSVSTSVLSANAAPALAIMADVVENPIFAPKELERARSQRLNALAVDYQRPGSIALMLANPVVFAGTPLGHSGDGDPASLKSINRSDVVALHHLYWRPDNAVLVITGDVTPEAGFHLAQDAFGSWAKPSAPLPATPPIEARVAPHSVAVDLPGTGQAAVVLTGPALPRRDPRYFRALVANDVLGGGYSARLNEEIRVKRGLSYGAGSELQATRSAGLFFADAQTRNDAAAQVAALMREQIAELATQTASADELTARKSALVGAYGRTVATADGLAGQLGALAIGDAPLSQLDSYPEQVEAVSAGQVQEIARRLFDPAEMSLIVVGQGHAFLPALK
ncbi:MAG: M16 family metallopeptidase, partial [Caulobacteraceae bacterium]